MNTIENSKLILELFNYKKSLTIEQNDVERLVNNHIELFRCDETGRIPSQKAIVTSLVEKLQSFNYDKSVVNLCESVKDTLEQDKLFYDLEDLYRQLESSNQGEIYRHPMQVVLNILNENTDRDRTVRILNELRLHDWIPAVKNFMFKFTTNPLDRQNISSKGGKAELVYSVVERVTNEKENGFLTFVGDKWFFLSEGNIEPTTPSNHTTDIDRLKSLGLLEKALRIGTIADDQITFEIEEGMEIGIDFKNGDIFLNGEKADKQTTLESVFQSPIVPFMRRDMYPIIAESVKCLDKFIELDIVQRITNITQPTLECYAFNYKDRMFVYNMDKRYGHLFMEYDSATMLVREMNQSLGFDLSKFYEDKFSAEINTKRNLEDREKRILSKISELNENIDKLEISGLLEINEQVKMAHEQLGEELAKRNRQLKYVKRLLSESKSVK